MGKDYNIYKNLDYQCLEMVKHHIGSVTEFYKLRKNRDRERELEREFVFEMEENGYVAYKIKYWKIAIKTHLIN